MTPKNIVIFTQPKDRHAFAVDYTPSVIINAVTASIAGVAGLSTPVGPPTEPAHPAAARAAPDCSAVAGWEMIAARQPDYVMFGELHGTNDSPALIGSIACSLALDGKKVLVALELDSEADDNLQSAWQAPHDRFASMALRAGWAGNGEGNGSRAMLAMLTRLHLLKTEGYNIAVVAFGGMRTEDQRRRFGGLVGQEPWEAASADNIQAASRRYGDAIVLVQIGNIHANRQVIRRGNVRFRPMAMFLADDPQPLTKVTADMVQCGPHPTRGSANWPARCVLD